jgi:metal-sulfur cluster biosynthetic enzyme
LHNVYDLELGVNVVDLGLIYGVDLDAEGRVTVTMTLTTPRCSMHEALAAALAAVPGVTGGDIRLVWSPQEDPSRITPEERHALGFWD